MIVHVTAHPSVLAARPGRLQRQFELKLPPNATVGEVLSRLVLPPDVVVVVNSHAVADLATRLAQDDNIMLLAPISGG